MSLAIRNNHLNFENGFLGNQPVVGDVSSSKKRNGEEGTSSEVSKKQKHFEEDQTATCLNFSLSKEELTDKTFQEHLKKIGMLKELYWGFCDYEVTDESLTALKGKAHDLITLQLGTGGQLTEKGLSALMTHCLNLETLQFADCDRIGNIFVTSLIHCSHLQKLTLRNSSNLTDEGVGILLSSIPHVKYLDIEDCEKCTDVAFTELKEKDTPVSLESLEKLRMGVSHFIGDKGITAILSLTKKIKGLNVRMCDQLTGSFMESSAPYLTNLEKLNVSSCKALKDDSFLQLAKDFSPSLKKLNFFGTPITHQTIQRLTTMNLGSSLETLLLGACREFRSIKAFPAFSNLKNLNLRAICLDRPESGSALSPLQDCKKLEILDISFIESHDLSLPFAPIKVKLKAEEVLPIVQKISSLQKLFVIGIYTENFKPMGKLNDHTEVITTLLY